MWADAKDVLDQSEVAHISGDMDVTIPARYEMRCYCIFVPKRVAVTMKQKGSPSLRGDWHMRQTWLVLLRFGLLAILTKGWNPNGPRRASFTREGGWPYIGKAKHARSDPIGMQTASNQPEGDLPLQ